MSPSMTSKTSRIRNSEFLQTVCAPPYENEVEWLEIKLYFHIRFWPVQHCEVRQSHLLSQSFHLAVWSPESWKPNCLLPKQDGLVGDNASQFWRHLKMIWDQVLQDTPWNTVKAMPRGRRLNEALCRAERETSTPNMFQHKEITMWQW